MVGWWPSLPKTGDWMIGCWKIVAIGSMSSEDRSKQVDGIHPLYSDSLYPCCDQPITSLATISPLLSQPTGRSEDPHRYWCRCIVLLSWFSWPPMLMNPCSMFRFFLCHGHIVEHGSSRLRCKPEIWNVDPDWQPNIWVRVCYLIQRTSLPLGDKLVPSTSSWRLAEWIRPSGVFQNHSTNNLSLWWDEH